MTTNYWKMGELLALGAAFALAMIYAVATLLALILSPLDRWRATDGTDKDWRTRSGFTLRTDWGTGCQYLEARGKLTPRLRADGSQVCIVRTGARP